MINFFRFEILSVYFLDPTALVVLFIPVCDAFVNNASHVHYINTLIVLIKYVLYVILDNEPKTNTTTLF